jgi:hypothetical protein
MRLSIIYQPESEHTRKVEDFVHDFFKLHPENPVQLIDANSQAATPLIETYDIMQYPAFMVTTDDGRLQNMWSGGTFPMMDEVMGYLHV